MKRTRFGGLYQEVEHRRAHALGAVIDERCKGGPRAFHNDPDAGRDRVREQEPQAWNGHHKMAHGIRGREVCHINNEVL